MPSPVKVGFTGTRNGMTTEQKADLRALLLLLRTEGCQEFHHGDAIGADEQAACIAKDVGFFIVCHPGYPPNHPEETKYRAFTTFNDEVRDPKPLIARDRDIVDETERMVAAPVSEDEEIRSGTWTTVRYARKQGREVTILNPKKTPKFDPHAVPVKTHRQRGIRWTSKS